MKRYLAIFIILTQVLSGACAKVDNGGTKEEEENTGVVSNEPFSLTVATCNVLKPSGRRDEMSLESPIVAKSLARSIIDTKADIIGFNELDENYIGSGQYSLKSACATIKDFSWKLEWPNDIHELTTVVTYSYANGFAFNSSKLQLDDSGYVWLSKEEDQWYVKPSSAYKKAGSPERTCIWAKMTHKATRKVFWLFVTHLPTDSQGGAENMAKVVNAFAAQKAGKDPAILTGDMNSSPSSAAYYNLTRFWKDGNKNSWGTLSGSSAKYYYTTSVFSDDRPDRRIDHIMTRGCTAKDYRRIIVNYTMDGKSWCPSDHLPVVCTVEFENK